MLDNPEIFRSAALQVNVPRIVDVKRRYAHERRDVVSLPTGRDVHVPDLRMLEERQVPLVAQDKEVAGCYLNELRK